MDYKNNKKTIKTSNLQNGKSQVGYKKNQANSYEKIA